MDRFLDDQENILPQQRDRSSSPSIHSLIYGDHKRQQNHRLPSDWPAGDPQTPVRAGTVTSGTARSLNVTSGVASHTNTAQPTYHSAVPVDRHCHLAGGCGEPTAKRVKYSHDSLTTSATSGGPVTVSGHLVEHIAADLELTTTCIQTISEMSQLIDSNLNSFITESSTVASQ